MAYWLTSRSANLLQAYHTRWRSDVRPVIEERKEELAGYARSTLARSKEIAPRPKPYSSLASAVHEAQREGR